MIRGETSDVLPAETFARMTASGAEGFEVPVTGHAPALLDASQIGVVRTFLTR